MAKKTVEKHFKDFDIYLDWIGAEKKPKTNPYEAFRFVANEIVCVIYNNKRGNYSYSNEEAQKVYYSFLDKKRINVSGNARKRFDNQMKENIIVRDGLSCFYTAVTLKPENMSIEHLIPVSKGGKNNLDNLVLCAKEINLEMADKPLVEKLKIRDQLLSEVKND